MGLQGCVLVHVYIDSISSAVSHDERSSDCGILTQLQAISLDMHCKLLWDGLRGSSQEIWKVCWSLKFEKT